MKNSLYVVHDIVKEESASIWESKNDATALRDYLASRKEQQYVEDYRLMCVGSFDHETNAMEVEGCPREVVPTVSSLQDVGPEEEA